MVDWVFQINILLFNQIFIIMWGSKMTANKKQKTISRGLSIPPYSSIMSDNDRTCPRGLPVKSSPLFRYIIDIHAEQTEENLRNGPFIKCDYLQEVVERERLNYVTVQLRPSKLVFFMNSPDMKKHFFNLKKNEEEEMVEYINNEEISSSLISVLDRDNHGKFVYDHHVILQMQKFLDDEDSDPLFCTFLLLKPTDRVCSHYIIEQESLENDELMQQTTRKKEICKFRKNKIESEILHKLHPLLYLEKDPFALNTIYMQECYADFTFVDSNYVSKLNSETSESLKTNEVILHPKEPAQMFCKNEIKSIDELDIESAVDVFDKSASAVKIPGLGGAINMYAATSSLSSSNMTQKFIHSKMSHEQIDSQKLNEQNQKAGRSITEFQAQKKDKNPPQSFSTNAEKETKVHLPKFKCTTKELWSI